jgi:hypothetical protein
VSHSTFNDDPASTDQRPTQLLAVQPAPLAPAPTDAEPTLPLPIDPAAAGSTLHDLQVPPQFGPLLDPANLPDGASNGLPGTPPQNMDPSYLNDLLKAIQAQNVGGNSALSALG